MASETPNLQIVVLDGYTLNHGDLSWDPILDLAEVDIYDYTAPDDVIDRSKKADILIINKVKVSKSVVSQLSRLKMVMVSATGYDNVDIEACRDLGIAVSNVGGYSTESVAQHTLAMLLAHINRVSRYQDQVANGRWSSQPHFSYYDHQIKALPAMKIGILGLGKIGQHVAAVLMSLGCEIIILESSSYNHPNITKMNRTDLLDCCDVLSLHLPLTDDTRHMVDRSYLQQMKDDAILINTARGAIIHEEDLAHHLTTYPKFTALLDVLSQEPPSADHPLLGLDNCHITPHQAWANAGSRQKLMQKMAEEIKHFLYQGKGNLV